MKGKALFLVGILCFLMTAGTLIYTGIYIFQHYGLGMTITGTIGLTVATLSLYLGLHAQLSREE